METLSPQSLYTQNSSEEDPYIDRFADVLVEMLSHVEWFQSSSEKNYADLEPIRWIEEYIDYLLIDPMFDSLRNEMFLDIKNEIKTPAIAPMDLSPGSSAHHLKDWVKKNIFHSLNQNKIENNNFCDEMNL